MRFKLLAGLAALAVMACSSDPVAPTVTPVEQPQPSQGMVVVASQKINQIQRPNMEIYTDVMVPNTSVVPDNTSPATACDIMRKSVLANTVSDQKQKMVYDDYNVLQTNPVRYYNGLVVTGRLRIEFRGYVGYYSGQPIQCVRVEKVSFERARYYPIKPFQPADPPTRTWIGPQANNWGFCLGVACNGAGANLHVQVEARWNRYCEMDISVSNCSQTIYLGNLVWELPAGGYMDTGQWDVEVRANGYWTAWNYGGNPLNGIGPDAQMFGYWQWGPSRYYLIGAWGISTHADFKAYDDGIASWRCCGL